MKKRYIIISSLFLLTLAGTANAQRVNNTQKQQSKSFFKHNFEYQAKVQLSLGGASPIGIPAQIREIESFKPLNIFGIEGNVTKWLKDNQEFGIRTGLKYEGRGMKTQARVKNYYTQIEDDTGAQTKGYFTGHVVTEMKNTYLTLPLLFVWNATDHWNFYGGFYFSKSLGRNFTGYIYDGAFRESTPIGELTTFEGTTQGLYDFSDDIKPFQWGNQLGAEYKTSRNFRIFADLTIANTQLFKNNFESITFQMYNIYGNIGFGHTF